MLTKHGESGSARSHGPRVIPRFAVIGARLVWAEPTQLQVGPVPVCPPVQQRPVVEPGRGGGARVNNTMGVLGRGEGLHPRPSPCSTRRLQSSFLWVSEAPLITGGPCPQLGEGPMSKRQGTHQEYFLGMGVPEALQQKVTFWPACRTRDSGCFTR